MVLIYWEQILGELIIARAKGRFYSLYKNIVKFYQKEKWVNTVNKVNSCFNFVFTLLMEMLDSGNHKMYFEEILYL